MQEWTSGQVLAQQEKPSRKREPERRLLRWLKQELRRELEPQLRPPDELLQKWAWELGRAARGQALLSVRHSQGKT